MLDEELPLEDGEADKLGDLLTDAEGDTLAEGETDLLALGLLLKLCDQEVEADGEALELGLKDLLTDEEGLTELEGLPDADGDKEFEELEEGEALQLELEEGLEL